MTYTILTTAIILATFVGCVAFIAAYRPLDLRSHGPAGRHLLTMSWALALLYGMTLALMVVDLPRWVVQWVITVPILSLICFAVWQRYALHRRYGRRRVPR